MPEPFHRVERRAWLCLLPLLATALFYTLPDSLQGLTIVQLVPQLVAYVALVVWALANGDVVRRLWLDPAGFLTGLHWGLPTGIVLGTFNVWVIRWVVPGIGGDIRFLQDTPHAQLPLAVMVPWFILCIAVFVEVNFRGFLLGRVQILLQARGWEPSAALAILVSALAFSFDPFMVGTFRHLHWIAVWDGMVWGVLLLRTQSLYVPIVAHAIEVIVMYSALKAAFA